MSHQLSISGESVHQQVCQEKCCFKKHEKKKVELNDPLDRKEIAKWERIPEIGTMLALRSPEESRSKAEEPNCMHLPMRQSHMLQPFT